MNGMRVLGVVLAGGEARRMGGGDKVLLELAGKPLIQHVIDRVGPQVDALVLNANGDPARFAGLGLPVIPDTLGAGPLAGLLAGFEYAALQLASYDGVLIVPGDSPFPPSNLVENLCDAGAGGAAICSSGGRNHPVFGLFPLTLMSRLRSFLEAGHRKAGEWTTAVDAAIVSFDDTPIDPFFNINSPEDLEHAALLAKT